MNPTNDERARFEAHMISNFHWFPTWLGGSYSDDRVQALWTAWKTCSQSSPAAPGVVSDAMDDRCTCQGCGQRYSGDLYVPDDVWEQIKPTGKPVGAGLLCASCIMRRAVESGVWTAARANSVDRPTAKPSADDAPRPVGEIVEFGDRGKKHSVHARIDVSLTVGTKLYAGAPPADARDGGPMVQCAQCSELFPKPPEPHVHCPACCRRDSDRLDDVASEGLTIRPFDMPGGMGFKTVGWRVSDSSDCVVAEVFEDDVRAAIDRATRPGRAMGGE